MIITELKNLSNAARMQQQMNVDHSSSNPPVAQPHQPPFNKHSEDSIHHQLPQPPFQSPSPSQVPQPIPPSQIVLNANAQNILSSPVPNNNPMDNGLAPVAIFDPSALPKAPPIGGGGLSLVLGGSNGMNQQAVQNGNVNGAINGNGDSSGLGRALMPPSPISPIHHSFGRNSNAGAMNTNSLGHSQGINYPLPPNIR